MHRFARPVIAGLLALASLAPAPARAAGLIGIDAMSSTVMQEGQSSFSGLGLRARLTSVQLMPGVEILPSIEWWRNASTVQPFGIETQRRDATLAADVRYGFQRQGWTPYLGAGLAAHFLTDEVHAPSLGLSHQRRSLLKGGVSLLAGAAFPMTQRFENFVELKYHHVTDYRQLKLNWGLSYKL